MFRFYGLSLQPTLFGEMSVMRSWGRIGTLGRQKVDIFATNDDAAKALSRLLAAKIKRGYRAAADEPR